MRLFSALTECVSQQSHSEWICGFEKMAKEYLREASGSQDVKVGMNGGQLPCVWRRIFSSINLPNCALDFEVQIGRTGDKKIVLWIFASSKSKMYLHL